MMDNNEHECDGSENQAGVVNDLDPNENSKKQSIYPDIIFRHGEFIQNDSRYPPLLLVPSNESSFRDNSSLLVVILKSLFNIVSCFMFQGRQHYTSDLNDKSDIESQQRLSPLDAHGNDVIDDGIYRPKSIEANKYNAIKNEHQKCGRVKSRLCRDDKTNFSEENEPKLHEKFDVEWRRLPTLHSHIVPMSVDEPVDERIVSKWGGEKDKKEAVFALEITVENAKLFDHPHVNNEERLVRKIDQALDKYKTSNRKGCVENYGIRVSAIIKEIMRLKTFASDQNVENEKQQHNYFCLYQELLNLIAIVVESEMDAYNLYCDILNHWQDLLKTRETQGYNSTVKHLIGSMRKDEAKKGTTFGESIKLLENNLSWFATKVELYRHTVEAAVVEENVKKAFESLSIAQTCRGVRTDLEFSPKKRNQLADEHNISKNNTRINTRIPQHEIRRREKIKSHRYYIKLFIDTQLVDTTSDCAIEWPSLEVNFQHGFEVILDEYPRSIVMKIYQYKFGFMDALISTIHVATPGGKKEFKNVSLELVAACEEWYHFSNTYDKPNRKCIDGSILIKTEWRIVDDNKYYHNDPLLGNIIKPTQKCNMIQNVSTTMEKDYYIGLNTMKPSLRSALNDESLRYKSYGTKHSFSNSAVFKEPTRHKLMKQRKYLADHMNMDEVKIPLQERFANQEGTQTSVDEEQEENITEEAIRERILVEPGNVTSFLKKLMKAKIAFQHKNIRASSTLCGFDEVVHDHSHIKAQAPPGDWGWIFNLMFPQRKRSLYPQSVKPKESAGTSLSSFKNSRVFVTITSAKNAYSRQNIFSTNNDTSFLMSPPSIRRRMSSELGFLSSPKPGESFIMKGEESEGLRFCNKDTMYFVRLRFMGSIFDTRIQTGDCLIWEQKITIPLLSVNSASLTPSAIKQSDEFIEICLFDKVKLDYSMGGGYYTDEDTLTQENRFLGFLKVPISALHGGDNKQGDHFILNTPEVVLGYERLGSTKDTDETFTFPHFAHNSNDSFAHNSNDSSDPENQMPNDDPFNRPRFVTSINMSISLEPKFGCPSTRSSVTLPSNEPPLIEQYAKDWIDEYRNKSRFCADRDYQLLVPSLNGKTWLLDRYLYSVAPPTSCATCMYRCAHFVSLIQCMDDWSSLQHFTPDFDLWLPSQTFIDVLAGYSSEHAVLLANFFMFLNSQYSDSFYMDVYLAIGSTCLTKSTIYVVTKIKKPNEIITLWIPRTGKSYDIKDDACPQINIGTLVSSSNIYGNLQPITHPSLLSFDLNNTSNWKHFYNNVTNPKTSSLYPAQDLILQYSDTTTTKSCELEINLLKEIKTSIRGWRRQPSSFNNDVGNRLRQFLDDLEDNKRNGTPQKRSEEYLVSMNRILRGKNVFGFPLHFGFSNVEEILNRIEMTEIHQSKHPDVEFAVAVKIFPYECGLLSVWVFLCTLSPDHYDV